MCEAVECRIVRCKVDRVSGELNAGNLSEVWVSVSTKRPTPQYASKKRIGGRVLNADVVLSVYSSHCLPSPAKTNRASERVKGLLRNISYTVPSPGLLWP